VKGDMKYLFALMDDETSYLIAQEVADTKFIYEARNLFHKGKEAVSKTPARLITDGLPAFHDAFNKEFRTRKNPAEHINLFVNSGGIISNISVNFLSATSTTPSEHLAPIITVTNCASLSEMCMSWEFKTSLYSNNDTEIIRYQNINSLINRLLTTCENVLNQSET
jgi:transposase-like protein